MKTKSENIRLFEEARTLRNDTRSGLHAKAINSPQQQFDKDKIARINMHKKANKLGPSKG